MLTKFIIQKGKIGTLFAILISINQRKYEKRSWSFTGRRSWSFGSIKFNKHKKILTKKDKKYSDSYSDYHRHFDEKSHDDEHHGVEFYALK
jgi:hypothetical protein